MHYSAVSIIAALKANASLSCEGIDSIACPSPVPQSLIHEKSCSGDPSECVECKEEKCKQRVSIHKDLKMLRIIVFQFMKQNRAGFVHATDSVLMQLIKHNFINKNMLEII